VQLRLKNLDWLPTEDGRSSANLILAAVSLAGDNKVLASRIERVTVWSAVQDPTRKTESVTRLPLTIRIPRKTKSVRVLMESEKGGRIGAADLDRKTIDAAPAAPTPAPQLAPQRQDYLRPGTPQARLQVAHWLHVYQFELSQPSNRPLTRSWGIGFYLARCLRPSFQLKSRSIGLPNALNRI
jgi:hypothetical protein